MSVPSRLGGWRRSGARSRTRSGRRSVKSPTVELLEEGRLPGDPAGVGRGAHDVLPRELPPALRRELDLREPVVAAERREAGDDRRRGEPAARRQEGRVARVVDEGRVERREHARPRADGEVDRLEGVAATVGGDGGHGRGDTLEVVVEQESGGEAEVVPGAQRGAEPLVGDDGVVGDLELLEQGRLEGDGAVPEKVAGIVVKYAQRRRPPGAGEGRRLEERAQRDLLRREARCPRRG